MKTSLFCFSRAQITKCLSTAVRSSVINPCKGSLPSPYANQVTSLTKTSISFNEFNRKLYSTKAATIADDYEEFRMEETIPAEPSKSDIDAKQKVKDIGAILKKFIITVHPDRFGKFPAISEANQASLTILNQFATVMQEYIVKKNPDGSYHAQKTDQLTQS